jgi:hypothetical protein
LLLAQKVIHVIESRTSISKTTIPIAAAGRIKISGAKIAKAGHKKEGTT